MKPKLELVSLRKKKNLAFGVIFAAWLFLVGALWNDSSSPRADLASVTPGRKGEEEGTPSPADPTDVIFRPTHRDTKATDSTASQSICPVPSSSFKPLTSFTFWGKTMNTSSPCPTAGLNNQLTMVMGLVHCSLGPSNAEKVFRFKDITCSPTGGKDTAAGERRRRFSVGGDDYEYQWFRWSELFHISRPAPERAICVADAHTWSEHAWMKKCPTFVDHIYGTPAFWAMRKSFALHEWFQTLSRELIIRYARGNEDTDTTSSTSAAPSHNTLHTPPFLAIHVRRGDYENFCRQTAKSSGVKKFRTAPFVWSVRATDAQLLDVVGLRPDQRPKQLSSSFMSSCFPATQKIVAHVGALCAKHPHVTFLFVATNSKSFLAELSTGLASSDVACARKLPVVTLQQYLDEQAALGGLKAAFHGYWGRRQWGTNANGDAAEGDTIAPAVITETERSLLDVNILSFASAMVLNKYSTFSQSAIDFRMVRDGTLNGTMIYWW